MKAQVGPLLNANGELIGDNREMAPILDDILASVFAIESVSTLPEVERSGRFVSCVPFQLERWLE